MRHGLTVARTIVCCLALASLAGCELFLGTQTTEQFPPPGRLVDIDGRKLQIDCRGSGSPTVVLESGANDIWGSYSWGAVQAEVASSTRVCSYTRAGYVWSDSPPAESDAESGARYLRAALASAEEQPPFVLVGHSSGSLTNLIFTDLFGNDVAALVFVEPSHPQQDARRAQAGIAVENDAPLASVKLLRALRWTGLPRAFSSYCEEASMGQQAIDSCKAYLPHSLDGYLSEAASRPLVDARAAQVRDLGARPVLVLTRQFKDEWFGTDADAKAELLKREAHWQSLHAEMAGWSSSGEQRLVPDSGHGLPFTHPQVVASGIKDIVQRVRSTANKEIEP